MAFTIPGFVIVVFVLWYTVGVWRSTDRYFKDEYKKHLREQYKRNKYLREDEIQQLLAQKDKKKGNQDEESIKELFEDSDLADEKANFQHQTTSKHRSESYTDELHTTDDAQATTTISKDNRNQKAIDKNPSLEMKIEKKNEEIDEDDWIEDNAPPSREKTCHLDDNYCQINTAKKVNSKIKTYDYTDDEFCFLNGNSEKYCNP